MRSFSKFQSFLQFPRLDCVIFQISQKESGKRLVSCHHNVRTDTERSDNYKLAKYVSYQSFFWVLISWKLLQMPSMKVLDMLELARKLSGIHMFRTVYSNQTHFRLNNSYGPRNMVRLLRIESELFWLSILNTMLPRVLNTHMILHFSLSSLHLLKYNLSNLSTLNILSKTHTLCKCSIIAYIWRMAWNSKHIVTRTVFLSGYCFTKVFDFL